MVPPAVAAQIAAVVASAVRSAGITDPAVVAVVADLAAVARAVRTDAAPAAQRRWITVTAAARLAGRKPRAIRARCERGTVPAVQLPGGAWRIDADVFTRLLESENA
jgi:hypothetical protein